MDQADPPPDASRNPTPDPPPGRGRPRWGRRIVALVVVLAIAGFVAWRIYEVRHTGAPGGHGARGGMGMRGGGGGHGGFANIAQPVSVATAARGEMPITITALGTVTPLADVTVRTQLSGTLQSVHFQEGQMVKAGDVLAQIDPRPYQISLANAEGQLARDDALLATARLDLKRYRMLLAQDSIASQQVDTQASLVKQYEGTVKSDQANVDTYKLDLTYARITAPVAGRVGLRQVDPGNYVTPGDANGIVVLTQLQPISVIFTTSEDNLPAIMKRLHAGAQMPVAAYDRSNTTPLANGMLQTLDNQIDTTTGTVKLRASFPNADEMLFPNQFVNARLLVDTLHGVVIVPSSAILNGSSGPYVYVVKDDDTVTVRQVKPGPVDGERTSVQSGLEAGERVVVDGSDRLREGAKVTIPAARPASEAQGASAAHAHRWGASGAFAASGPRGHRRRHRGSDPDAGSGSSSPAAGQ